MTDGDYKADAECEFVPAQRFGLVADECDWDDTVDPFLLCTVR